MPNNVFKFSKKQRKRRSGNCLISETYFLLRVEQLTGCTSLKIVFLTSTSFLWLCELIHCMEWSPFLAFKKCPSILWSPKFYYFIRKSPLPVFVLSQMSLVPTIQSCFLQILLKLSLHLHLRVLSGLFPSGVPTTTLYDFLFSLVSVTWSVCFVPYNLRP